MKANGTSLYYFCNFLCTCNYFKIKVFLKCQWLGLMDSDLISLGWGLGINMFEKLPK